MFVILKIETFPHLHSIVMTRRIRLNEESLITWRENPFNN